VAAERSTKSRIGSEVAHHTGGRTKTYQDGQTRLSATGVSAEPDMQGYLAGPAQSNAA